MYFQSVLPSWRDGKGTGGFLLIIGMPIDSLLDWSSKIREYIRYQRKTRYFEAIERALRYLREVMWKQACLYSYLT